MTELGVFARVFPPGPPDAVATAIVAAGFSVTQLNLVAVGRRTLDTELTDAEAAKIGTAFRAAGVGVWGVSGTFNAIHPDGTVRAAGIAGCRAVIARTPAIGAGFVTLCTGTRDPTDMWRAHAENGSESAWTDLRATLDELIPAAIAAGVRLGIEPEAGNVIRGTDAAVRLLRELGDDARHVAIVLDPANLLSVATLDRQTAILTGAFERLAPWTAVLHAKDVVAEGYSAPGAGGMDYDLVMRLHGTLPEPVPVIAQDLTADDAPRVAALLRDKLANAAAGNA